MIISLESPPSNLWKSMFCNDFCGLTFILSLKEDYRPGDDQSMERQRKGRAGRKFPHTT